MPSAPRPPADEPPARRRPDSGLVLVRRVLWLALAVLVGAMAYLLLNPRDPLDQSGRATIGGAFNLHASNGSLVSNTSLKGKPFVIFFGFTQCPDICPTAMMEISEDLKALDPLARDLRVYFVTVDPERDSAALLADYISAFDGRIIGLVPQSAEELTSLAKAYRVYYRKVPTPSGYTMDHTAALYLMDKNGDFAGTITPNDTPANRRAKLKRLLG